jgi:hypothetical protein
LFLNWAALYHIARENARKSAKLHWAELVRWAFIAACPPCRPPCGDSLVLAVAFPHHQVQETSAPRPGGTAACKVKCQVEYQVEYRAKYQVEDQARNEERCGGE